jgi:hypothetical protein
MAPGSLTTLPAETPTPDATPVAAARDLADALLRPQAEAVDQGVVPRAHLDAIAAAGLLGVTAPAELGGGGHPAPVGRAVVEQLAAACGATWFVFTQHSLPLATAVRTGHGRAPDLASGRVLSGVAVAHLRRPGPPAVTATRTPGGWRFDGHVGWMSSWGICDVFLLAAVAGDEVVTALVDAREQPGLTASDPMRLAAMTATQTVSLDLDGFEVRDADVLEVAPLQPWLESDRQKTANPSPHTVGLQQECTRRLAERGGTAALLADRLAEEGAALRDAAYALIDDVPPAERLDDRLAVRAASLDLVLRSATALVAATGGSAMDLARAPQRLLREAAFHVVQAQTGPVREATLQHWLGS